MEMLKAGIFPDAIAHFSLEERFVCRGLAKSQKIQIPSDLVVRYQAIDIVGVILSFIW
jgi:hypothetical protein